MDELQLRLAHNGYRLTQPRRLLFEVLADTDQPRSLTTIHELLSTIDRSSIYRTLTLYQQLNIVRVVHVGWKKLYELAEPFSPHHHHLQCTVCGELLDIDTPALEHLTESIAHHYGYTLTSHHFELEGICSRCRRV